MTCAILHPDQQGHDRHGPEAAELQGSPGYGVRMSQWWELVIPAGAAVAGTVFGALVQGVNERRRYTAEAGERRKMRFIEERRVAYVRYLAALAEWEPLRAEAWRLREEMDQSQDREAAERQWRSARADAEPSFRRLVAANQEIQLIAPKSVRAAATTLFVEASRTRAVARFREELITAIRLDLGTDADPREATSVLLASGALGSGAHE
jgi:hypothetical protein